MDAADAADVIGEANEGPDTDKFRSRAALLIAVLAAVLAIAGLGGGNATDDLIHNNIKASDTWAFYQAKNVRQTMHELEVERLEAELAVATGPARAALEKRIADNKATIARYDSEPDKAQPNNPAAGEGKEQLRARAEGYEEAREVAAARDDNFDLAEVFLQLALVLGSVAILALNRPTLLGAIGLGLLGSALTLNGFLLLFVLPI
jgi:hypothetical protein